MLGLYTTLMALLLLVAVALVEASSADPPTYRCVKVASPPRIDGNVNDAAWRRIKAVKPFILHDGSGPAMRQTEARMCWDDRCLYIAFVCEDPDIWGTFTKRDDPIYEEEAVEVFLDPDCDLKHYYEINMSPRNVVFDAHVTNSSGVGPDRGSWAKWDCAGLKTAVRIEGTLDDRTDRDTRWTVEMAIPFKSLDEAGNSHPKPGDVWLANLYRIDRTPEPEHSCWSPTLRHPPAFHVPSRFGRLRFEK